MHYVTLEQIDQFLKRKASHKKHFFIWNILKEVFQFGVVFLTVFLLSTVVINANLFYHTLKNVFATARADDVTLTMHTMNAQANGGAHGTGDQLVDDQSQFLEQQVAASIESSAVLPDHTETMSYYLSAKMKNHVFSFNTLPPQNRLIIPAIGVDVPIVDVTAASAKQLKLGDFDQELFSGVVKYPSTPEPGITGNALILGHSSYYWRKKNPYAEIFAKLPALKEGDLIQALRHGQLTEFEIVAKEIVYPNQVDETYLKYNDGSYITLMGCYPIGSDAKRILIIAKKKSQTSVGLFKKSK